MDNKLTIDHEEMKKQIKIHLNIVFQEIEAFLGFKPKCYIAGGSIASIVLHEIPKDYDVWFELPDYFHEVDKAIVNPHKRSKYATTVILSSGKVIQFVQNRMGVPKALVPQFDFKHAQSYYTQEDELFVDIDFINSRTLTLAGRFDHPINTMERVLKFSKRGYYVPFETLQTIMLEINKMSPETIKNMQQHGGSL